VAFSTTRISSSASQHSLDVTADAVLAMVERRPRPERALEVAPTPLHMEELLVGRGKVLGGQRDVAWRWCRRRSGSGRD
jgi:hypothetical protein